MYRISPKKLIICFSGTTRVILNPPHQKFVFYFQYSVSSVGLHRELSVKVGHHLPPFCLIWLVVDDQLVAALTKSRKFLEITQIHLFYSILLKKKLKSCLPASFSKKGA